MNVKTIADQFCERPAVPASSHSAGRLAERWRLSDFFELTKPRVMELCVPAQGRRTGRVLEQQNPCASDKGRADADA